MIERTPAADTVVDEVEERRERAERLRWINEHIREASEADLIEEAEIVEDEEA